jgi:16S rRNA (uracil1498-N3)-methyltransferase
MEEFIFEIENRRIDPGGVDTITLKGEEHFHLSRVLRSRVNDKVFATDGKGTTCLCVVQSIGKERSTCKVIEEYRELNSSRREFCIGMAVLKPVSKLELAIEKCTELGGRSFLLFNSERTEKINLRAERVAGVIRAAIKQSLQSVIPEFAILRNLEEVVSRSRVYENKFVLHERSEDMLDGYLSSSKKDSSVIALVGPEGGFSEEEINFLIGQGFRSVCVGKSRLRSETASIKIASLLADY